MFLARPDDTNSSSIPSFDPPPSSCSSECDLTNDGNVKWEERDKLAPLYRMHLQMYLEPYSGCIAMYIQGLFQAYMTTKSMSEL